MLKLKIAFSFMTLCIMIIEVDAQTSSPSDVYAEYCFQQKYTMNLYLSKELKRIEPISIAVTDSIECENIDSFPIQEKTSFHIFGTKSVLLFFSGGGSITTTIRTTYDSSTGKIFCNQQPREKPVTKKYMRKRSSLISIQFQKNESLIFENGNEIPLEYMQQFIGKPILAEWKVSVNCKPTIDTTYTGTYPIRITGECPEEDIVP